MRRRRVVLVLSVVLTMALAVIGFEWPAGAAVAPQGAGCPSSAPAAVQCTVDNNRVPGAAANLVPNPSFEIDTSGWVGQGTSAFSVSTDWAAPGAGYQSAKMVAFGGTMTLDASQANAAMGVVAGDRYFGSVKMHPGNLAAAGRNVYLIVLWYKADGTLPAPNQTRLLLTPSVIGRDSYVAGYAVAPAGATVGGLSIQFAGAVAGETWYYDAVTFQRVEPLAPSAVPCPTSVTTAYPCTYAVNPTPAAGWSPAPCPSGVPAGEAPCVYSLNGGGGAGASAVPCPSDVAAGASPYPCVWAVNSSVAPGTDITPITAGLSSFQSSAVAGIALVLFVAGALLFVVWRRRS